MGPIVKNCTDDVSLFFISASRAFFLKFKTIRVFISRVGLWLGNFKCKKNRRCPSSLLIQDMSLGIILSDHFGK